MSEEKKVMDNEQELSEILQVRRDKLAELQQAGRNPFEQTKFVRSAWSSEIKDNYEDFDGKNVSVAGRIMSKRGMGKAIFCHIKDDKGLIQLYIRADAVSAQEFADFRKYDIGDIIGVSGYVFKTKTEEISVHVEKVVLLSKSLRPLPEKFHGMTNTELKYRQRYVDLIVNDESRRNFEIRSKFISYVRRFLEEMDIGVTYISGRGAYSGKEKKVIMCVMKKQLSPMAEEIIRQEDPQAFMIVTSATEIYGEGYKNIFSQKL